MRKTKLAALTALYAAGMVLLTGIVLANAPPAPSPLQATFSLEGRIQGRQPPGNPSCCADEQTAYEDHYTRAVEEQPVRMQGVLRASKAQLSGKPPAAQAPRWRLELQHAQLNAHYSMHLPVKHSSLLL